MWSKKHLVSCQKWIDPAHAKPCIWRGLLCEWTLGVAPSVHLTRAVSEVLLFCFASLHVGFFSLVDEDVGLVHACFWLCMVCYRWVKFDTLGHYLYTGICNNTTVTRAPVHDVVHRSELSQPSEFFFVSSSHSSCSFFFFVFIVSEREISVAVVCVFSGQSFPKVHHLRETLYAPSNFVK